MKISRFLFFIPILFPLLVSGNLAYGHEAPVEKAGIYTTVYQTADGKFIKQSTYVNPATGTKVRLYVIGDSTASDYDASRFPRTGWAQILQGFFNRDSVEVVNKALSGRSSKSFYTDPSGWKTVRNALQPGDYLFIQFGHNDEKSGDTALYTEPYTTFQEYLKRYVDTARSLGAIPVLLTPIHRNGWSGDQINDSHGVYPPAMRQLAQEEDVPLIDLTEKTRFLFETCGKETVTSEFFMNLPDSLYRYYPEGNGDNTHLQIRGAYEVATLVYRALEQQSNEEGIGKLYRGSLPAGFIQTRVKEFDMGRIAGDQVVPMDSVTLLSTVASRGYLFDHFSLNGEVLSGGSGVEVMISDSLQEITAWFVTSYRVRISTDPYNGAGYSGNGEYGAGDTVTVVAVPDAGYRFLNWTISDTLVSTDSAYTFVMGEADVELMAHLEQTVSVTPVQTRDPVVSYEPAGEILLIRSPSPVTAVQIFNIQGRLLRGEGAAGASTQVDMSGLEDGIYVVRVRTSQGILSHKFIKFGYEH